MLIKKAAAVAVIAGCATCVSATAALADTGAAHGAVRLHDGGVVVFNATATDGSTGPFSLATGTVRVLGHGRPFIGHVQALATSTGSGDGCFVFWICDFPGSRTQGSAVMIATRGSHQALVVATTSTTGSAVYTFLDESGCRAGSGPSSAVSVVSGAGNPSFASFYGAIAPWICADGGL